MFFNVQSKSGFISILVNPELDPLYWFLIRNDLIEIRPCRKFCIWSKKFRKTLIRVLNSTVLDIRVVVGYFNREFNHWSARENVSTFTLKLWRFYVFFVLIARRVPNPAHLKSSRLDQNRFHISEYKYLKKILTDYR